MKSIQLNNYEFYYSDEGDGSPVIFVHGSISDYRTWRNQIPTFSKHFHTIVYSRRYHYPSANDEITDEYTVQNHRNDLAAFIEALGLNSVNLVGSSYGAYVSLLFALEHSDQVKSLVLCEPPIISLLVSNLNNPFQILSLLVRDFSTGKSFLRFGMKAMFPATKKLRQENLDEGVRLFSNGVLGEGGFEKLPEDIKAKMLDNAKALKAELLGPGFPKFSEKDAAELKVPCLLVCGEKSPKFFHSITDKLYNLLPETEQIVIPGVSHNMHEANPENYNHKVFDFLTKQN